MNIKKISHLKNNNGSPYYQRRWPKAIQGHPQIKTTHYSKPIGYSGNDEHELYKAWERQHKVFEDYVALLRLANQDAIDAKRELELAHALLEANNLKPGMLCPDNPLLTPEQNEAVVEAADYLITDTGIFDDRERARQSPQLHILDRAWQLLKEPASETRKSIVTLQDCWDAYVADKQLDIAERGQ